MISCVRPGVFEARAIALAAGQRVDEAGLADIGAAGKADLGAVGGGQAVHCDDALHEIDRTGKEQARSFGDIGLGLGGNRERDFHGSTSSLMRISAPVTTSAKMPKSVWP